MKTKEINKPIVFDKTKESHVMCKIILVLTYLKSKPNNKDKFYSIEQIKELFTSTSSASPIIKLEDMPTDEIIKNCLIALRHNALLAICNISGKVSFNSSLYRDYLMGGK